jgi:glutamate/tyrosine decarboxylase-like PLP-dependent enzyme
LPPLALYGSTELHFTNVKAVRLLGLGSGCVRQVAVDEHYRLDPAALETAIARDRADGIEPAIVVAHVGSPNTGAVDPLPAIADLCAEHGLWLHVDAAYGAFCRLCPRTAPLVKTALPRGRSSISASQPSTSCSSSVAAGPSAQRPVFWSTAATQAWAIAAAGRTPPVT